MPTCGYGQSDLTLDAFVIAVDRVLSSSAQKQSSAWLIESADFHPPPQGPRAQVRSSQIANADSSGL